MISGMVRQLLPYAPQVKRALYAKLATALFLKALRQVVDSTAGDVVQLVRTLPRHWLESYTVTADTFLTFFVSCTCIPHLACIRAHFIALFAVCTSDRRCHRAFGSEFSDEPLILRRLTPKLDSENGQVGPQFGPRN